jgi:hypothetical protein
MKSPKKINWRLLHHLARAADMRRVYSGPEPTYCPGTATVYISQGNFILALRGKPNRAAVDYVRSLAHEIGHWVVAPPSRRVLKNFGIRLSEFDESVRWWDLEDTKATLVQHAIEHAVGLRRKWPTGSHQLSKARSWWRREGSEKARVFIDLKRLKQRRP